MDHRPRPSPCASFSLSVRPSCRPSVRQLASESIFSPSDAPLFFRGISTAAQSPMRSNAMRARPPPPPLTTATAPLQSISQFVLLPPSRDRQSERIRARGLRLRRSVVGRGHRWRRAEAGGGEGGSMSLWVDQVRPRTKPHAVISGSPALPPFLLSSHSRPARPLVFRSFPPYPSFALFEPSPVLRERAASASAMCVHPHHSLPPSLCWAWPGQAGRRRSLHHLVSPIFRLLAIYPPPSPRRRRPTGPSHSRSPRRTGAVE